MTEPDRTWGFHGPPGPLQRCGSCEHPRDFHDDFGCNFTVLHVRHGRMADCPCAVPDPIYATLVWTAAKEDTTDATE